jgi:hypothetical protein
MEGQDQAYAVQVPEIPVHPSQQVVAEVVLPTIESPEESHQEMESLTASLERGI